MIENIQALKTIQKLRWLILLASLTLLLVSQFLFKNQNSYLLSYCLCFLYFISNIVLNFLNKKRNAQNSRLLFGIFSFDSLYFLALILLNGSSHNPFTIIYILIAGFGALLLDKKHLLILIAIGFFSMGLIYSGNFDSKMSHHGSDFQIHLQGMWLANSLAMILGALLIYKLRKTKEDIELENQKTQKALMQIEKIESLGQMVATASHKLNSSLGTIQLFLDSIKSNKWTSQEKEEWIHDSEKALEHMTSIISRMKEPVKNSHKSEKINLIPFLKENINRWKKGRDINLTSHFETESIIVHFSFAEDCRDCLFAILDNSFDALKNETKKKIELSLKLKDNFMELIICDNGMGVPQDMIDKIKEPLFTTKTQGTGLGLYTCQKIAEKYKGGIDISSRLHEETQVSLKLRIS